jgi:predicted SnoaL-like aldol condensation-catalyzing enzyme
MEVSNKQKVVALLKSIETGDSNPIGYINPNKYIQHNLGVGDGLTGFGAVLHALPPNSAKVNTARVFQDGDFVFAHTSYNFFGPKIGFDIFRFEDGKIVEHWDNLQQTAKPNSSGHTMIDGTTEVKDLDKTEANKQIAKGFVTVILMDADYGKIENYIDKDRYIQHNPSIGDGLQDFLEMQLPKLKDGTLLRHTKLYKVLGEGNFVLTVSEAKTDTADKAFYNLFRIENGKIAEHWDTIEAIPNQTEWKNKNGKF